MQHFNLSLAQRYTRPEIRIASLLITKAYEDEELIAYDVSLHVLKAIQRVKEHKTSTDASQAQRKLPPFLGGALMLTRIAYHAIGKIDQLPPPLDEDNNIQFHQKPYRQKAKPDKADKHKRDSTDSATGSQAKKMRGHIFGADTKEEKNETQGDSHDDQQEPSDESDEDRTHFNVDDFLSTLEETLVSLRQAFGPEDIAKYSAQLEAAQLKSIRVAKEEKKRRKEEARTKLAQEVGSSQAPMVSRAPILGPTLQHPHDLDTQMDTSSSDFDKEQGQGEVQVPHLGVAQSQEPSAEAGASNSSRQTFGHNFRASKGSWD